MAYAEGRADAWFDLAEGLQEGDLNGAGLARVIEEGKRARARLQGPSKRKREYKEGQAHVMAHLAGYLREGHLPEPRGPSWKTGPPELPPPGAGPGGYGSAAL